jgi:hypothetical protein
MGSKGRLPVVGAHNHRLMRACGGKEWCQRSADAVSPARDGQEHRLCPSRCGAERLHQVLSCGAAVAQGLQLLIQRCQGPTAEGKAPARQQGGRLRRGHGHFCAHRRKHGARAFAHRADLGSARGQGQAYRRSG